MEQATGNAKLIFVALPAFGHDHFFKTMIPYLKDGHVVVVLSGNLGALRLRALLKKQHISPRITIYETNTMPGGSRITGPGKVNVVPSSVGPWLGTDRPKLPYPFVISALPAVNMNVALKEIQKLYPLFIPVKNVLIEALNHVHHLTHAPVVLLNTGRIEDAGEDFMLLRDGQTPAVQRVQLAIRDELAMIARELGGEILLPDELPRVLTEMMKKHPVSYSSSGARYGPDPFKNRFITEDTPYGLVPVAQLGKKMGINTPLLDAFISIASAINGEDYNKTGRTLASLGLQRLKKDGILELVENG
jgi:opine dehydrogenase